MDLSQTKWVRRFEKGKDKLARMFLPVGRNGWERARIPQAMRHGLRALKDNVKKHHIQMMMNPHIGPPAAFTVFAVAILGIRWLGRHPFTRAIRNLLLRFFGERSVQLAGKGVLSLAAAWCAWVVYTIAVIRKRWLTWPPPRSPGVKVDPRPVMCFGGSLFLDTFYNGVIAYCQDHFDMSQVRMSGLSGATVQMAASGLIEDPILRLRVCLLCMERIVDYYDGGMPMLVELDKCEQIFCDEMFLAGVTDRTAAECADRNVHYSQITEVHWHRIFGVPIFPYLVPKVCPLPRTLYGIIQLCLRSCCLPFSIFGSPPVMRDGRYVIDGGFSALFPVPEDADISKTVTVHCFDKFNADIKMPWNPWFHLWRKWFPVSRRDAVHLFSQGYQRAAEGHHIFLEKGFVEKCVFFI